ncbi:MAG: hypothetical protein P8N94_03595 [Gammaproteobacteria bacterium]|jgi:hypothetical protein|nr:hypothetical protein [Gammaproteobacteria bacterium]MDG2337059.1 hypothetical protein [Gammaproteobacteria bacterium]
MKSFSHSKLTLAAITLASSLATTSAFADYHLTAFSETLGFKALISEDISATEATFASRSVKNMDYFEANNLCVAQIILEDFDSAIASCSGALDKAEFSSELTIEKEKIALAAIYSNLAVAKAMIGDTAGANVDLEMALTLNKRDDNANINYDLISTNLLAGS